MSNGSLRAGFIKVFQLINSTRGHNDNLLYDMKIKKGRKHKKVKQNACENEKAENNCNLLAVFYTMEHLKANKCIYYLFPESLFSGLYIF